MPSPKGRSTRRASCDPSKCAFRERCSTSTCPSELSHSTLAHCQVGDKKLVKFVCPNNQKLCHKLSSMGLIEGALVEVLSFAPFGDPMMIAIGRSRLALRRDEAVMIETEKTDPTKEPY